MGAQFSAFEAFVEIVKQVGFPVVVACWFMFRTDKRLESLTEAVNKLVKK